MAAEAGHLDRSACMSFLQLASAAKENATRVAGLVDAVKGLEAEHASECDEFNATPEAEETD